MQNLAENPHLQSLLAERGLEIFLGQDAALNLEDITSIRVGNVLPQGTVVGFHFDETDCEAPLRAIVYDPSKEGDDGALTIIRCRFF